MCWANYGMALTLVALMSNSVFSVFQNLESVKVENKLLICYKYNLTSKLYIILVIYIIAVSCVLRRVRVNAASRFMFEAL